MTSQELNSYYSKVKKEFFSNNFENGDCLNLAVAMHEFLISKKIKSHVIPVMRNFSPFDLSVVFDHAVLLVEIDNYHIELGFDSNYSFDVNGNNAYQRWIENSSFKNTEGIKFWINRPPENLEDFCASSQDLYGDEFLKKMLNNKELRDRIVCFLNKN